MPTKAAFTFRRTASRPARKSEIPFAKRSQVDTDAFTAGMLINLPHGTTGVRQNNLIATGKLNLIPYVQGQGYYTAGTQAQLKRIPAAQAERVKETCEKLGLLPIPSAILVALPQAHRKVDSQHLLKSTIDVTTGPARPGGTVKDLLQKDPKLPVHVLRFTGKTWRHETYQAIAA